MEMVINFSGGKDSSAMLQFLCERYPNIKKHVVFADTGAEYKDKPGHWVSTEEWSRRIAARFGLELHTVRNPNKDFFSMVRHRRKFPSPGQRQCTSDLKRGPIQTWIRRNVRDPVVINCMGMRAEESPARAKKLRISRDKTLTNGKRTVWNWLPIHRWTEKQVREYLVEHDIPLHPAYKFLNRLSCEMCIYMTKRDLRAVRDHNPEAFERIANLEQEIGFTMQPGGTVRETADQPEKRRSSPPVEGRCR